MNNERATASRWDARASGRMAGDRVSRIRPIPAELIEKFALIKIDATEMLSSTIEGERLVALY